MTEMTPEVRLGALLADNYTRRKSLELLLHTLDGLKEMAALGEAAASLEENRQQLLDGTALLEVQRQELHRAIRAAGLDPEVLENMADALTPTEASLAQVDAALNELREEL